MDEWAVQEVTSLWNPLPERFSGNWQVDVVHVAEDYSVEMRAGENLSLAVAAYSEPTGTMPREDVAWRIDFSGCQAYRKRIIGYAGAAALTRPNQVSAFWEIAPSRYVLESGVHSAYPSAEIHHYVILAAIHAAYEVLASGWRCTELPREWARPFSGGPFPRW